MNKISTTIKKFKTNDKSLSYRPPEFKRNTEAETKFIDLLLPTENRKMKDLSKSYDFGKVNGFKSKIVKPSEDLEIHQNGWLIKHRSRIIMEALERIEEGINLNGKSSIFFKKELKSRLYHSFANHDIHQYE